MQVTVVNTNIYKYRLTYYFILQAQSNTNDWIQFKNKTVMYMFDFCHLMIKLEK